MLHFIFEADLGSGHKIKTEYGLQVERNLGGGDAVWVGLFDYLEQCLLQVAPLPISALPGVDGLDLADPDSVVELGDELVARVAFCPGLVELDGQVGDARGKPNALGVDSRAGLDQAFHQRGKLLHRGTSFKGIPGKATAQPGNQVKKCRLARTGISWVKCLVTPRPLSAEADRLQVGQGSANF